MYDMMSLPPTLLDLDDVPTEFKALYQTDDDGLFVLTQTATANFAKVADGIAHLAEQRDQAAAKAQAALVDIQVMAGVLGAGASGKLAAAAAALFESENKIATRDGHPVVTTDRGDVPLRDAIADFMQVEGSIFLPSTKPSEHEDHYLNQIRGFAK